MANLLVMAHGEEAEIVLLAFAEGPAVQHAKESNTAITPEPVAYLRCDLDTQRHFLAALLETIDKAPA